MSEHTSTNEEDLINHLDDLEEEEYIHFEPKTFCIDAYKIPLCMTFERLSKEQLEKFWIGSFGGFAFHKDVWKLPEDAIIHAGKYR